MNQSKFHHQNCYHHYCRPTACLNDSREFNLLVAYVIVRPLPTINRDRTMESGEKRTKNYGIGVGQKNGTRKKIPSGRSVAAAMIGGELN